MIFGFSLYISKHMLATIWMQWSIPATWCVQQCDKHGWHHKLCPLYSFKGLCNTFCNTFDNRLKSTLHIISLVICFLGFRHLTAVFALMTIIVQQSECITCIGSSSLLRSQCRSVQTSLCSAQGRSRPKCEIFPFCWANRVLLLLKNDASFVLTCQDVEP